MYTLYGSKGAGSTTIEALLELLGETCTFEEAAPWEEGPALERLRTVNPLVQVPTLILPDGTVMTESAAMIFALLDRHPDARLMPPPGDAARPLFFRWVTFLAGSLYPMYTIGDYPERWVDDPAAQAQLKQASVARIQRCWQILEESLRPAPYLLGADLTALDVYAAMISHWRPGRAWVNASCPRVAGALEQAESHPTVARVWKRNFGK